MKKNLIQAAIAIMLLAAVPLQAATYRIDPDHSSVRFRIKHLTISKVNGTFGTVAGSFTFQEDDPAAWQATATIDLASVDTGNAKRDDHLRSDEFFDTAQYPTMVFKSTRVEMTSDTEGVLHGELTLHGATHPVTLELEYNGSVADPWGNQRAGFSATGKLNRKDWGLTYNSALESGGLLIGEEVRISLEIEGIRAD